MNKKLLSLPLMMLLAVGLVSASPFNYNSLVLHLPFEEGTGTTTTDESGSNNDGTLIGNPIWTQGVKGGAVEFDGNNDYVDLSSSPVTSTPFTVCAWVYMDTLPSAHGDEYVIFGLSDNSNSDFVNLRVDDTSNQAQFNFRQNSGTTRSTASTISVQSDQWEFICGVSRSANDRSVYINANEEGTSTASVQPQNINTANIGALKINSRSDYFNGKIDEVAVWNVALTDAEILEVYNAGFAPPDNTTPSVPQNLMSNGSTETTITLSWDASSDPESGIDHYNVYRDNVLVASPTVNNHFDSGLSVGTAYTYEVSAVNGAGLESARSTALVASTLADTTAPEVVSVFAGNDFVNVTFSEEIDTVSAENTANYNIGNGVAVTSAQKTGPNTVLLSTTPHSEYTLTVNGVEDTSGNPANDADNYSPLGCFI